MFHKIRLFTTEKGFRDEGVQQLLDKVSVISKNCQYEIFESGLSRIELELTKDGEVDALCYLDDILERLLELGQAYDYECGDSYADYGAYFQYYRPDQTFDPVLSPNGNRHVMQKYAEVNSFDMDASFHKIIELIKAGEYAEAIKYAKGCAYPEVNDLEDYIEEDAK